MNIFPVGGVGSIGMVADKKPHELPFQAWSDARNVRFLDAFVEKFLGETSYTTPNIAPYFLLPVPTVTNIFWLLAGLAKTHCFDGTAHTDITRTVGGDYAATEDLNWTGSVFNGIPLINNSVDAPQMWSPVAASQALQALSNWPANTTCRTLRAFRNFLIAGDITKSGTRYKQMVKWSHPAGVGALPSSWDETDATKDAGEWPLAETPGAILDFVPLRDLNIVYKEDAVYKMQWVGGVYVFSFRELTTEIGLLSRRCAVGFKPAFKRFWVKVTSTGMMGSKLCRFSTGACGGGWLIISTRRTTSVVLLWRMQKSPKCGFVSRRVEIRCPLLQSCGIGKTTR